MQKLILDTNIIVSALISNSFPTQIFYELVLTKAIDTCLSDVIFAENIEVLPRENFDKFGNFKIKADVVLNKLRETGRYQTPDRKVKILSDLSDNKFLEVAAANSADYLITGNKLDFTITEFEYTRIVSPKEYWNNYKP